MIPDNAAKQYSRSRSPSPIHKTNESLNDIEDNIRFMYFTLFFIFAGFASYIGFFLTLLIYFNVYYIISKIMRIPVTDSRYLKYFLFGLFLHLVICLVNSEKLDEAIVGLFFAIILHAVIEFFVYLSTHQGEYKKINVIYHVEI